MRPSFAHGAIGPPIVLDPDQPAPEDTPWGFFSHRSCWCLLEAIFHPQDIPLRTFNDFAALAHSSGASLIGATTTAE